MYNINKGENDTLFMDNIALSNQESYDNFDDMFTDEMLTSLDQIDSAKCDHIFDEDF